MANSNVSANAATIHLYAEHLQNIRTVSVQACLATHSNNATKATLSADGSTLSLTHEGQSVSIRLPVNVPSGHNDTTLHIPAAPPSSKELTFRLSLEEKPGSNSNLPSERTGTPSTVVPWMAQDLSPQTEICCATCNTVLMVRGTVRQWKDLPSEGWAEMMDFWHCHKPDVPHNQGHNGSTARGISANSKLAVQQGIGLVGPLHLLLAHEDCQGLSVGPHGSPIACTPHLFSTERYKLSLFGRFKEPALSCRKATLKERRRDTCSLDQTPRGSRISQPRSRGGRLCCLPSLPVYRFTVGSRSLWALAGLNLDTSYSHIKQASIDHLYSSSPKIFADTYRCR